MKKSLLTRAIATAVSMPLAVSQCLVPAFAAPNGGTNPYEINIKSFTNVAVDAEFTEKAEGTYVQQSAWNEKIDAAFLLLADSKSFDVDTEELFKTIVDNAGNFADEAQMILDNIKNVKATYGSDGKIVITADLENLAATVEGKCKEEIGKGIDELKAKYGTDKTADLKGFNLICPEISGKFELVIDLSKVGTKKGGTISATFTDEKGEAHHIAGANAFTDYVVNKIDLVKADTDKELKKLIGDTAEKFDAAKADLDSAKLKLSEAQSELDKAKSLGLNVEDKQAELTQAQNDLNDAVALYNAAYTDFDMAGGAAIDKANEYFNKWYKLIDKATGKADSALQGKKEGKFNSVNEILAAVKKKAPSKYAGKIPTSVNSIVSNKTVNDIFNNVSAQLNDAAADAGCVVNLSLDDASKLANELSDITVSYETGNAAFMAEFADDQYTDLVKYFKDEKGMEVTESVKKIEVTANLLGMAVSSGDFTVDVYREFKATKSDVPQTTTTTTSTTTPEATTTTTTTTPEETTTTTTTTTPEETTTTTTTTPEETTTTTTTTPEETTTTTTTTPEETTTTTTTTTPPETTTTTTVPYAYKTCYASVANYEAEAGFYFSDDTTSFSRNQIKKLVVDIVDTEDRVIENVDLLDATNRAKYGITLSFGTASPAATFDEEKGNKYEVPVMINGEQLSNKDGSIIYVMDAYIGVKGDADLSNTVDASDASSILAYYAETQTGGSPALNEDENLNKLALFLADVDADEKDDASDASFVLSFYTKVQTGSPKNAETWAEILGN